MNFCIYPQGLFPQLGITAIVVPGTELGDAMEDGSRFLDNRRIQGTISEMTEEAVAFCLRNMKQRTVIDPDTGQRRDQAEYPIGAIREAVLNALIHRDYSVHTEGTPVQLNLFQTAWRFTALESLWTHDCRAIRLFPSRFGKSRLGFDGGEPDQRREPLFWDSHYAQGDEGLGASRTSISKPAE